MGPAGPQGTDHLVEARVSLDLYMDILDEPVGLEQKQAYYPEEQLPKQLDALVELAKAARDAVTAWPMPMKMP